MEIIIISFFLGVIVVGGPLLIALSMKCTDDEDHTKITTEDMEIVLENLRMGASRYEERVIDAIIEKIGGAE